jgi:diguanylate cyclase (GGDEF)-like protein
LGRPDPQPAAEPTERAIRRSWWVLAGSFLLLGLVSGARLLASSPQPFDWIAAALLVVAGLAVLVHHGAVQTLEQSRRGEAESFARILQGLSRSVSPDAIVAAIVEELGVATGADHLVVIRRPPGTRLLEATLVSRRPGVASSTTLVPFSDLEAPTGDEVEAFGPVAVAMVGAGRTANGAGASAPAAAASGGNGHAPSGAAARGPRIARPRGQDDPAQATGRQAQVVADRLAARVRSLYGLKHALAAPLRTPEGVVGAIVLSRRTAEPWTPASRRLLEAAAVEASAALTRAHSLRAAETLASTDGLTGLPNRRYFDEFCGLLARRRRAEDAIGVLMIDIDRFKALNDSRGHAVGDEVLRSVARAIAGAVREHDVPARYGGEEFAVLLRNPTPEVAAEVAERVRVAVRSLDLTRLGVGRVSVSVGVAMAISPDQAISDVIQVADRALYDAKATGRDRVVAA